MSEIRPPDQPDTENGEGFDAEFSLARSNALIPLLIMFAVTVFAIVVVIVRAKPIVPPEGAVANKAFGPADFPLVFATEEASTAPAAAAANMGAAIPLALNAINPN
jgi:hypothetical protein